MALAGASLQSFFESRGVSLVELSPAERVPRAFTDPVAEHLATRLRAGLFDFSFMACMELSGRESLAALEVVQPRRLVDLAVGKIRYTLLMGDDGRVLNDATVWRTREQGYLLFVGRHSDLERVLHHSRSYDVRLVDRSSEFAVLALQGPNSRVVLPRVVDLAETVPYFGFTEASFRRQRCLVANLGYSGEAGFEIVAPAELGPALWNSIIEAGGDRVQECGFDAADTLRIEAGHILFSRELALNVTPEELAFERLVELPAHRRKLRSRAPERRLVGLSFDERSRPLPLERLGASGFASAITERARASATSDAVVTSSCFSPTLGRSIGLGYVPWESRYPGTRISVGPVRATVARRPMYDPGKRLPRMQ